MPTHGRAPAGPGVRPMKPSSLVCQSASSGTGDLRAVLPALPQHLVHRQHALVQHPAPVLVEPVVLPGGAGEVPGVHEDVVRVELRDRLRRAASRAACGWANAAARRRRVVEDLLHRARRGAPTRRPGRRRPRARAAGGRRRRRRGTPGTSRAGAGRRRAPSSPAPAPAASHPSAAAPRTRSVKVPAMLRCSAAGSVGMLTARRPSPAARRGRRSPR